MVFPIAKAGANFQACISIGKFHQKFELISLKHALVTNWNYLPYNPNGGVASIAKVVACDWNCFPVVFISPAGIVSKNGKNIDRKKTLYCQLNPPPPFRKFRWFILPKNVLLLPFFRFFGKIRNDKKLEIERVQTMFSAKFRYDGMTLRHQKTSIQIMSRMC